ncbi:unnamed protein product [Fusarium fujikuroi]|uniref:Uncharacterized protein n=1 Tax=Fusarium fujikuroi TaxID=5127 RepID=A0A9Q9UC72_FUSFU|nr:unnamed protein product [Fusarium fujikuroi]VZH95047.1 unnamed protein product [Fusarium fujikuroi]
MNRRLERLYELGVLRARLQADEEGLPTFVAMPNKPLKLLAPANYYRESLSVTLRRLFTAGENDFATKASTAVNSTRLQILGDLKAMDEFLAKSTTSATAEKLADGESLTRYPQAMARIIRYDGDDVAHDVKEHDENSFVIINAFSEEMAQARDEDPRAYAWGNVARAAEHMRKFLEWQLNADLLVSMNQAMNGLDLPSDDEEVRSEQEVD